MTGIDLFTIAGTAFTAGDALLAASTIVGAIGGIQQGRAQKAAARQQEQSAAHQQVLANAQAQAQEQQAGQERAVAQRGAIEQRRQGKFVSSEAQAIAAASGAGALDPTIVGILGDIETETELRALTALYEGEERARGLEHGAAITRAGGAGELFAGRAEARLSRSRARRSFLSTGTTLLEGGSSLFARYATEPSPTARARARPRATGPFSYNFGWG